MQNYQLPVSLCFPYRIQSIGLTGNFRIWNRFFPKWEFGGGESACCSLEHFSGKNSRLTEVPFWDCPEGIFHFITQTLYRGLFLISEWISCYRIAKYACQRAEIRRRVLAPGDDSKNPPWRAFCRRGFLVFVTWRLPTFQIPLFRFCHFLLRKQKHELSNA